MSVHATRDRALRTAQHAMNLAGRIATLVIVAVAAFAFGWAVKSLSSDPAEQRIPPIELDEQPPGSSSVPELPEMSTPTTIDDSTGASLVPPVLVEPLPQPTTAPTTVAEPSPATTPTPAPAVGPPGPPPADDDDDDDDDDDGDDDDDDDDDDD